MNNIISKTIISPLVISNFIKERNARGSEAFIAPDAMVEAIAVKATMQAEQPGKSYNN